MNKAELASIIAAEHDVTKAVATSILNTALTAIVETVKNGDSVQLLGFGTFKQVARAARDGRNPSTGAAIQIAAANLPKFVAGASFKEALSAEPSKAKSKGTAAPSAKSAGTTKKK